VQQLYQILVAQKPEILFFESPYEALKERGEFVANSPELVSEFDELDAQIAEKNSSNIKFSPDMWKKLYELRNGHDLGLWHGVKYLIQQQLDVKFKKISSRCRWFDPSLDISNNITIRDFEASVIDPNIPSMDSWELLKSLNEQMGWYNLLDGVCIVCDRPIIRNFDDKRDLHMDGAPAVEYSDGFSVYAFHGIVLPKKYGEIPSSKWDPQWLLEKTSDKMRRTLLSGMSFGAIQETLKLKEIDNWKKYRLWEVENETKGKPIVLLTKETDQGIVTDSVAARLKKVKKAVEWLHLRYCQEDIFDGD
jgi:hypothetical protein